MENGLLNQSVRLIAPVLLFLGLAALLGPVNRSVDATQYTLGPFCRAGVSFWDPLAESQMDIGWEIDFAISTSNMVQSAYGNGATYYPMIRLKPNSTEDNGLNSGYRITNTSLSDSPGQLGDVVTNNPGQVWIVGNEVDRVEAQDSLVPSAYATAYHDIYQFIKKRDPSAQVAFSALVQVTPGRLQYLDLVWDSYRQQYGHTMPVDVWTFHAYILHEKDFYTGEANTASIALGTDPEIAIKSSGGNSSNCSRDDVICFQEHDDIDLFKGMVVNMRQWMKDKGQQDKPLVLTEYGTLYPYKYPGSNDVFFDESGNGFTPSRVTDFLNNSTAYLETATDVNLGYPADDFKLVQQWAWFAIYIDPSTASLANSASLVNQDRSGLTMMGQAYRDRISSQSASMYVDLILEDVGPGVGFTSDGVSSDGQVSLMTQIRNVGTSKSTQPITLRIRDSGGTVVGTSTIPAGLQGCGTTISMSSVDWTTAPTGLSNVTVEIVSSEDNNSGDNSLSTLVLVDPDFQIQLPVVSFSN